MENKNIFLNYAIKCDTWSQMLALEKKAEKLGLYGYDFSEGNFLSGMVYFALDSEGVAFSVFYRPMNSRLDGKLETEISYADFARLHNIGCIDIAIDFDGTCVTHAYPETGSDIGAVEVLRDLVKNGNRLILFTMRSHEFLERAVDWFKYHDIPLYGVQYNPTQRSWTGSNKCYAQLYIDDAALGCPLIYPNNGERPYVDWVQVRTMLTQKGLL